MMDITSEQYWEEKIENIKEHKLSRSNKIVMIGLIAFGICTVINSVLIYTFFNLLKEI